MAETGNSSAPVTTRDSATTELWRRLSQVKCMRVTTLTASTGNPEGKMDSEGTGTVVVDASRPDTLVYEEKGAWIRESRNISFNNKIEWRLFPDAGRIRCSHLRYGNDNPEHLAEFFASTKLTWSSTEPYLCADDVYEGTLKLGPTSLTLTWRVTGPHKNQLINCVYS